MKIKSSRQMRYLQFTICVILCLGFSLSETKAQSTSQDSLRVLITKYLTHTSEGEIVTISAVMEKDSAMLPTFIIGDSTVNFISDIRVDAIEKLSYIYGNKIPKSLKKKMPNGFIMLDLKGNEMVQMAQFIPSEKIEDRIAFVTRLSINDFDNRNGRLSTLAKHLVDSYGTDDQIFRVQKEYSKNTTPILAIDSLNHRTFVSSMSEFREGCIETIDAYDAVNAMKIIGDKGVDGLFVVIIKSKFTLREALLSPLEKIRNQSMEMEGINMTSLVVRNPIIIKE